MQVKEILRLWGVVFVSFVLSSTNFRVQSSAALSRTTNFGLKYLWEQRYGEHDNDSFNSVVLDGRGGVYLSGESEASLFGSIVGLRDIIVAKISSFTASVLWKRQFGQIQKELKFVSGAVDNDNGDLLLLIQSNTSCVLMRVAGTSGVTAFSKSVGAGACSAMCIMGAQGYVGSRAGLITVDIKNGAVLATTTSHPLSDVSSIACSPQGQFLAVASGPSVWRLTASALGAATWSWNSSNGSVLSLAVDSKGDVYALLPSSAVRLGGLDGAALWASPPLRAANSTNTPSPLLSGQLALFQDKALLFSLRALSSAGGGCAAVWGQLDALTGRLLLAWDEAAHAAAQGKGTDAVDGQQVRCTGSLAEHDTGLIYTAGRLSPSSSSSSSSEEARGAYVRAYQDRAQNAAFCAAAAQAYHPSCLPPRGSAALGAVLAAAAGVLISVLACLYCVRSCCCGAAALGDEDEDLAVISNGRFSRLFSSGSDSGYLSRADSGSRYVVVDAGCGVLVRKQGPQDEDEEVVDLPDHMVVFGDVLMEPQDAHSLRLQLQAGDEEKVEHALDGYPPLDIAPVSCVSSAASVDEEAKEPFHQVA